jgi:hypothetical protein
METLLTETSDSAAKTEEQNKQDEEEQARKAALELELAEMGV